MIAVTFQVSRMRELRPPTHYGEGLTLIAEQEPLAADLVKRLEKTAGFRNLFVHKYEDLDEQEVPADIAPALGDGAAFFRTVIALTDT